MLIALLVLAAPADSLLPFRGDRPARPCLQQNPIATGAPLRPPWPPRSGPAKPDPSRLRLLTRVITRTPLNDYDSFARSQLNAPRVRESRTELGDTLKAHLAAKGLTYPPAALFIRIFKLERVVEVWARGDEMPHLVEVASYPMCASSGLLGPKRRRGDLQIPEGFYSVDRFNPTSNFYLSLGIDYPNRSDHKLKAGPNPGGSIFIHGDCVTIGCVPIADDIKALYLLALDTYLHTGKANIPVHIFPRRLDDEGMAALRDAAQDTPELLRFWESLKPGYDAFERTRRVPAVQVDKDGYYRLPSDP